MASHDGTLKSWARQREPNQEPIQEPSECLVPFLESCLPWAPVGDSRLAVLDAVAANAETDLAEERLVVRWPLSRAARWVLPRAALLCVQRQEGRVCKRLLLLVAGLWVAVRENEGTQLWVESDGGPVCERRARELAAVEALGMLLATLHGVVAKERGGLEREWATEAADLQALSCVEKCEATLWATILAQTSAWELAPF